MGKMMRNEGNVIRPRKSTSWASESSKSKKVPIFKIGENDFAVNVPPGNLSYNYYLNEPHAAKQLPLPNETPSDTKKSLLNQIEKYCEKTTLHGLRYVGDSHLTFGERIFWFISFSLAMGFAAYYITNIYTKWKSSPVIISFSPFDAELSSIPFPAITICNMNQAKKSEAMKILKEGSNVEKKLLDDSCNGNASFENTENISWESLRDFLVRTGNSCADILKSCQWGRDKINCDEVFNNHLTDEGLCCSFNRLPPEKIFRNLKDISILNQTYPSNVYDWDAEKGFQDTYNGDFIPRRPLGAGAHLGLSIILDAQVDNYYCSSTRSTGFKVILSNPLETPKMADFGFLISPGFETRISLEPSVREATPSLRSVPIEKRQCYFSNERPLQYYRSYTQKNCMQECFSNFILRECHCVPYYFPKNSKYTNYCGQAEENCTIKVINEVGNLENGSYLDGECQCRPACFEISYKHLTSKCPILPSSLRKSNISSKDTKSIVVATFFFTQEVSQRQVKTVLYGFSEILSNFGGILSLCLGLSFLSVVEILYFVSLRIICFFASEKKRGKNMKNMQLGKSPLKKAAVIYPGDVQIAHMAYTQRNCLLECQSNHTLKLCLCIPYYLPKNRQLKYCGKTEKDCVEIAKLDMETVDGNGSSCHCLPSCFSTHYTHHKSFAGLSHQLAKNIDIPAISSTYFASNMAVLQFYFHKSQFTKELKSELYGFTEILSNVGGLLSLCLGFSFLSLVELIYFITLRIICDIAQHAKRAHRRQKGTPAIPFLR